MDFSEPLTILDYYLVELEWRFDLLLNQIWEIYDELGDIKEALEYDLFLVGHCYRMACMSSFFFFYEFFSFLKKLILSTWVTAKFFIDSLIH